MARIASLSPLNAIAAAAAVLASLLVPPVVYGIVAHVHLVASMESQAQLDAAAINTEIISKAPQLWKFQDVRLNEMMSHRVPRELLTKEFLRVIDSDEKVVAAVGTPLPWPFIARSRPLFDAGRLVGRLEIQRSLRPLLVDAAWLSLFGLLLAGASFVTLRIIPLRAVLSANDALQLRTDDLTREVDERKRAEAALQESKQLTEAILNAVPARIFWKDKNLVYLGCNEAFAHDAGFSRPEDLIGKDDYQMVWRDQAGLYRSADRQVIESGRPKLLIDEPQTTPEGTTITLLTSKIPLLGSNGAIAGVLGTYMDVTERARLQAQLAFSNLLNTTAMENAPDGILVVDENAMIVSFNTPFVKMWNIPAELAESRQDEPILRMVMEHIVNEKAFLARVKYLYEHPDERSHEELLLKDERVIDRHSAPLHDANQKYLGRIWFFRDITEAKRAEQLTHEELHRTQSQLQMIGQVAQSEALISGDVEAIAREITEQASRVTGCERVNVWLFNDDETVLHCIDLFEATPGRHSSGMTLAEKDFRHEIAAIKTSKYVDANDPLTDPRTAGYIEPYLKPLHITSMLDATIQVSGKHFGLLCFEHVNKAHHWEQDEIAFACQLADKIGLAILSRLRRLAEEAIKKSEEKYRNLVESTTDYIWEMDQDGRYSYVSPAVKPLLGYEPQELMGKSPFDLLLMPAAEGQRVAAEFSRIAAAREPILQFENIALHKDGREIVLETSGVPIFDRDGSFCGYRGIDRNVTKRKRAELALQQRDALLHAVATAATELVTAPTLDDAIPNALKMVGSTLHIDRIAVLDRPSATDAAPVLHFVWHAPDAKFILDKKYFENPALMTPQIVAWHAPLRKGRIVTADLRTATDDIKRMLETLGTQSLLVIPVSIDGRYWGQVGFESCKSEREWAVFEIEILQSLADLIGNAIRRDRYVNEIADANRIIQNSPTILYRLRGEPSLPMVYVSQNIKLFGHEPAALIAAPLLYQSLIHPDDIAGVREVMAHFLDKDSHRGSFEYRIMTGRGDYRWVENRYSPVRDDAGRLIEIEGLLIDITERKAAEEKISLLARTDPLTGLANRTTFIERLQNSFAAARRGGTRFAVHYLDIDRFKDTNDTLGHPVGDRLLITVGERLKASVRETDQVARIGGDEFAVLQADLSDTADAGTLAAKIRSSLAEPVQIAGNELRITASIGIAIYEPDTAVPEDMLAQADVALYRAKEEGRDQYRFHTEELDVQVREQVAITDELRLALSRGEFELYYQPQVELSTNKIVGMEALLRWNHPKRGLLMPSAFIAAAERTGTIAAIGHWALDHACQQMSAWRAAGIAPPTIAVNISPVQIKASGEFVELVTITLAKWQLSPSDLELDVTESMLAGATLAQNDVLERLQKIGVKISIDDFGTKYSSLDYLKTYRVSRLKIPQPLVNAATRDPDSAAMVRAIVGIARELNIEVIAQGVETEAQWSYLTATSPVTKVQGYYYSAPLPSDRAKELLRRGRIAIPGAQHGADLAASA